MNKMLKPDYLFEVSWEVCNKMAGFIRLSRPKPSS